MALSWWVLLAISCGTFMATLDSSIVNLALPTISFEWGKDIAFTKWIVIAYYLAITATLLPFGKLSDQIGRKRCFLAGFTLFTLASVLCGASMSLGGLIFFRVIQGLGASLMMANGPALIGALFQPDERGKALGTLAMVVSFGLIAGPGIGGYLINWMGWRSVFFINFPIGITGIILGALSIKADQKSEASLPFDWPGTILQSLSLFALTILFDPPDISISGSDFFSLSRLVVGVMTVVFFALFIKVEFDSKNPVLDLDLFKDRTYTAANLSSFFIFCSYSSVVFLMPYFLEEVQHLPTNTAGLYMMAIPMVMLVVSPIAGRLSDRFGAQELSFFGCLVVVMSLTLMSGVIGEGVQSDSPPWVVLSFLGSIGLALGLFQAPNNNAIMGSVEISSLGSASALSATARNSGFVVGAGIAGAVFTWKFNTSDDYIESIQTAMMVASTVAAAALVVGLGKQRGAFWKGKK